MSATYRTAKLFYERRRFFLMIFCTFALVYNGKTHIFVHISLSNYYGIQFQRNIAKMATILDRSKNL